VQRKFHNWKQNEASVRILLIDYLGLGEPYAARPESLGHFQRRASDPPKGAAKTEIGSEVKLREIALASSSKVERKYGRAKEGGGPQFA